ncbi:LCP family protein [Jonesiaceae bacterium BS-20]|uniref:LCP family protein n=1 Tax=Jonesiaceae bacterium BS-20 TaxID=3120821 RepID=A0AAU7DVD5_9MICO
MTQTSPAPRMPESAGSYRRTKPGHARSGPSRGVLKAIALVVVGLLAFGSSAAFAGIYRIQNMATKVDVSDLVSAPAPRPDLPPADNEKGQSLNILVLGTDYRGGDNAELSDSATGGMRSDTTMVIHLSSDRTRAEVVSIPRDSMVEIPECLTTDGQVLQAQRRAMFNSAFARGWDYGGDIASAAACTINTIQHNTGLTIDHFVVIDFAGYKDIVDALGGIDIEIPEDISVAKVGGFKLEAGWHTLNGTDALKLVRGRKGTGWGLEMGSDLSRIDRQQAVVNATIETALSKNFLTDLPKLTGFVTAAISSLTMNPELSNNLVGLATSLTGISTGDVEFISTPVATDPYDKNRVVWTSAADELWERLLLDNPPVTEVDPDSTAPETGAGNAN